jgi:hypothetical protein
VSIERRWQLRPRPTGRNPRPSLLFKDRTGDAPNAILNASAECARDLGPVAKMEMIHSLAIRSVL